VRTHWQFRSLKHLFSPRLCFPSLITNLHCQSPRINLPPVPLSMRSIQRDYLGQKAATAVCSKGCTLQTCWVRKEGQS
jgi:hypothetical protein